MSSSDKGKKSLKEKLFHEFVEFWTLVLYFTLMFAAFIQYRRLVLAAHDINYTNYFLALIKAFIFAKVIMVGEALRIGRFFEKAPLIYSTICKSIMFTLFLGVFTVCEYVIISLWNGEGFMAGPIDFFAIGTHELLSRALILFVAFLPFFAIRDLSQVLGEGKLRKLFFKSRTLASDLSNPDLESTEQTTNNEEQL